MNVKTFIDRPILSGVISVAILIIGLIALGQLPLEQYPDIAPPTVTVMANYSGASAETVMKSVVVPLEESINGVENMTYMTSSATNAGGASIRIFFKQGTDPDMSVVNVQNRVGEAQRLLPAEVVQSGVTVRKMQTGTLMFVSLYSPDDSFAANFLTNYMQINLEPRLSRIPGVGEVNIFGARYSMRIWLDPGKMAMYSLVPEDISAVLAEQNIEAATGKLGLETDNVFVYTLKYRGRYEKEEDFENMVVKSLPDGRLLRLGDVARIELGAQQYNFFNEVNGHPSCNCMIVQTSGSNANEVIKAVQKEFKEFEKDLPKGMKLVTVMSIKDFLDASIKEVVKTLLIAILLVILVVYFFLHDLKATLIPTISIIVSLVGTFAFIYAAGFSLNLLTLFALVLVIGTVVDDSIVVVEAVQAKFDDGYTSPYRATVDAMKGLTSAIVTNTLVFMAVFIPVCFMGGTTGIFYTQFGLTMAAAVGISCINSLTLSPALCAIMLKPRSKPEDGTKMSFSDRFHYSWNRVFERFKDAYSWFELRLFHRKWISWVLLAAAVATLGTLLATTSTSLVPQEDLGSITVNVQAAPGTNLEETSRITSEVEEIIKDIPQVELYSRTTGSDARRTTTTAAASFNLRLKNWDERTKKEDSEKAVMAEIYRRTSHISAAQIRLSTRPMIAGYGSGSGFELYVQDKKGGTIEDLLKYSRSFIDDLNKREEISRAYTSFDTKYPQFVVDVDAVLCKRNGVSPKSVLSVLAGYVGGVYASNINRFTKIYRVMIQASPEFRASPEAFNNIYVRSTTGEMSPVSQYIHLTRVYGSESLSRFNLFPSIAVYGESGNGHSSGEAIDAIRQTCALYESVTVPLAIILSVPFGLAGSFLFAKMWGIDNNIYLQIGLIMLIGLLAKTAVLLTEYATQARRSGMSITQAGMSAAKDRLRPILMTSLTMIIGLLPLVFASGAGANGDRAVGVGAAGGMLVGTIALLVFTPIFSIVFLYLHEKMFPHWREKKEDTE